MYKLNLKRTEHTANGDPQMDASHLMIHQTSRGLWKNIYCVVAPSANHLFSSRENGMKSLQCLRQSHLNLNCCIPAHIDCPFLHFPSPSESHTETQSDHMNLVSLSLALSCAENALKHYVMSTQYQEGILKKS